MAATALAQALPSKVLFVSGGDFLYSDFANSLNILHEVLDEANGAATGLERFVPSTDWYLDEAPRKLNDVFEKALVLWNYDKAQDIADISDMDDPQSIDIGRIMYDLVDFISKNDTK